MQPETSDALKRFPVERFLMVLVVAVLLTGVLGYSFRVEDRLREEHLTLMEAVLETRLEATIANLFLEEMLAGNRLGQAQDVMGHFDRAAWHAGAMLAGGINPDGRMIPPAEPAIGPDIGELAVRLDVLRGLARERFASFAGSGRDGPQNQAYHAALAQFADASDRFQNKLRHEFKERQSVFRFFQVFMGVLLGAAVAFSGWFFYRFEQQRDAYLTALKARLCRIKGLRGILPICSACKRIRDADGRWKPVENYIRHHSEAEFSHSLCPVCTQKLYPGFP
ncbi:MAG TPA: hypothetical protein VK852_14690 [Desulfobacterales bacterium]|nr:hypothetical protein [Desulfobacterales bacterium]